MPVRSLDHVNIRTPDVMGTAAFLQDLLDLDPRIAPGAESIAQGCWMYDLGDRPIIHIAAQDSAYPSDGMMPFVSAPRNDAGTGALHHVALECTGRDATLARIEAAGHAVATSDIPQVGLRQLFVAEPNGILLELNFFE